MKYQIPQTGFLRLKQIIGDPGDPNAKTPKPAIPALIPVSKSSWWDGVKAGRYPQPIRSLGKRITCWRVEDISALIESTGSAAGSAK